MPLDPPSDVPHDTPRDVPLETPTNVPLDTPSDVLLDTPRDVPLDTPIEALSSFREQFLHVNVHDSIIKDDKNPTDHIK